MFRTSSATLLRQADAARDKGKWREAAGNYARFLDVEKHRHDVWVQYGHALKENGNLLDAVGAYERAIELNPNEADPLLHLAHLQKRLGKADAISTFERLRALTNNVELDNEISELRQFHKSEKPALNGSAGPKGSLGNGPANSTTQIRPSLIESKPTPPKPGLYRRPRGLRFVATSKQGPIRHKIRFRVDGREIWTGMVLANQIGTGGEHLLDIALSYPDPDWPSDTLLAEVEAVTVGLEPSSASIHLPYASRFEGSVSFLAHDGNGISAQVTFVDSDSLTTEPSVRVIGADGLPVPVKMLRHHAIKAKGGGTEFTCELLINSEAASVGSLNFYPMWSNKPLDVATRAEDLSSEEQLATEDAFTIEGNEPVVKLDAIRNGFASGWARLPLTPELRIVVDIMDKDRVVASGVANARRGDLAKVLASSGRHSYQIELPCNLPGNLELRARVRGAVEALSSKSFLAPPRANGRLVQAASTTLLNELVVITDECRFSDRGPSPRVAALILNRNGEKLLKDLFESIVVVNTHENLEIIVLDHDSKDSSQAVCAEFSDLLDIDFIPLGYNDSFSRSNNLGVERTSADIVFFLNNDTCFVNDIIPPMVRHFLNASVGAVGVRLVDRWTSYLDSVAGGYSDQHLGVFCLRGSSRVAMYEMRVAPQADLFSRSVVAVPAVTAAALMMRRADFLSLGGFDAQYFYGQEDVDLCLRVRESGKQIWCDNRYVLAHLRGITRARNARLDEAFGKIQARNRQIIDLAHGRKLGRRLRQTILKREQLTGVTLQIALVVTSTEDNSLAGDIFTAQELAKALAVELPFADIRLVAPSQNSSGGKWRIDVSGADVVIILRDDFDVRSFQNLSPSCFVIFWVRNCFDRFIESENWQYADEVWISSEKERRRFEELTGLQARLLRIATNWDVFTNAEPDPDYASDYCFTGSNWDVHREISVNVAPETLEAKFRIFGAGWEKDPVLKSYHFGPLNYSEMPRVYASTKVVIDDANHVTVKSGSVNSRVFDAIGAGALPLTNGLIGSKEVFGGALPTYSSAQELHGLLTHYLSDDEARASKVAELQAIVKANHTYVRRAQEVVEFLRLGEKRLPSVAIKIAAPSRDVRNQWGDYHYAEALRFELSQLGMRAGIFFLGEWESQAAAAADVTLVLRGLNRPKLLSRQLNLMWMISHPDAVSLEEYRDFDHVFAASDQIVSELAAGNVSASLAHQCSDVRRFNTDVGTLPNGPDVLFVGNSRGKLRQVVADAIAADLDLHIYGEGWNGLIPERFVKGSHIPNEELPRWYASAGVVLNDHWPSMSEAGVVSNRVFDILACGGRCISDQNEGLAAIFGDYVRTYTTTAELRSIVMDLLAHRGYDQEKRLRLAKMIAEEHSFKHRAKMIADKVTILLGS